MLDARTKRACAVLLLGMAFGSCSSAASAPLQQTAVGSTPSSSTLFSAATATTAAVEDPLATTVLAATQPSAVPPTATPPPNTPTPTVAPTSPPPTNTSAPTIPAAVEHSVRHIPLGDGVAFSYGHDHHDYPASDIFADCGSPVVAPIDGELLDIRTIDQWVKSVDNPATRGGKSIAMLGYDGVRYYMAHFSEIDASLVVGQKVVAGQSLGAVGMTGRAGACHVHFALSLPCAGKEWKVRRGVIWPWRYLDAWRAGTDLSPLEELQTWFADNPSACADALAEPTAGDV